MGILQCTDTGNYQANIKNNYQNVLKEICLPKVQQTTGESKNRKHQHTCCPWSLFPVHTKAITSYKKIPCKGQIKNKNIDVRYAINYEVDVT